MSLFKPDKFVDDKIMELKRNIVDLQQWATSNDITEREYRVRRSTKVNLVAIEALTGMEIREKNDRLKPGKAHKGPTVAQITDISECIQHLVDGVEKSARTEFERAKGETQDNDDTGIPRDYRPRNSIDVNLDAKAKELKESLLGDRSIVEEYFTGLDCLKIHQIGEKIRKEKNTKTILIIGAIVLSVAVVGGVVFFMWQRSKKKSEADAGSDAELDRIADHQMETMDTDPDLLACVDAVNSDVPHVRI